MIPRPTRPKPDTAKNKQRQMRTSTIKTLLAIRHAKSSWETPELDDRQRPLNKRGLRDAPFMGQQLALRKLSPDRILCSPALRATQTAQLIAAAVGYDSAGIEIREALYMQGPGAMLEILRALDTDWQRVYLVGHNPDITALVSVLADRVVSHLPTTGVAAITFDVDDWAHIMAGSGTLAFLDYPKRYA
jgi:phosphohistidine phosphatase